MFKRPGQSNLEEDASNQEMPEPVAIALEDLTPEERQILEKIVAIDAIANKQKLDTLHPRINRSLKIRRTLVGKILTSPWIALAAGVAAFMVASNIPTKYFVGNSYTHISKPLNKKKEDLTLLQKKLLEKHNGSTSVNPEQPETRAMVDPHTHQVVCGSTEKLGQISMGGNGPLVKVEMCGKTFEAPQDLARKLAIANRSALEKGLCIKVVSGFRDNETQSQLKKGAVSNQPTCQSDHESSIGAITVENWQKAQGQLWEAGFCGGDKKPSAPPSEFRLDDSCKAVKEKVEKKTVQELFKFLWKNRKNLKSLWDSWTEK